MLKINIVLSPKALFVFIGMFLFNLLPFNQALACESETKNQQNTLTFPPKPDSADPENDYVFQLLKLILAKSNDKYGPCIAKLLDHKLPLARMELYLAKGHLIQTVALTANIKRDERFTPIPIPVSKGLMGYRLFLIRKGDQDRFKKVGSITDLQQFVAGQGIGWADVKVLEENGLPVQDRLAV